jgi:hypothetical protein
MKPGYKTTEFWLTLLTAIPGIAVTAGLIPSADKTMLDSAASKIAAGLLAAITVAKYVQSRALVKSVPPASLIILAVLAFAGPVAAGPPAQATCWLPWRAGTERRLQQLEQQRQQPVSPSDPGLRDVLQQLVAQNQQILNLLQQRPNNPVPPPLIVLSPQQGPLQQIPLGGPPRQDIPLGGPPKQDIPLGGPPRQEIPLGPPPRQQIPLGEAPKQQLPLNETKPPPEPKPMPGATISYQRYSLWRTR